MLVIIASDLDCLSRTARGERENLTLLLGQRLNQSVQLVAIIVQLIVEPLVTSLN